MNRKRQYIILNHQEDEDASVNPIYGVQDIKMKNQSRRDPTAHMKTEASKNSPRSEQEFYHGERSNLRDQNYF